MSSASTPQELQDAILARMESNRLTGQHSALAELVGRVRTYLAAVDCGDVDLADHELHGLRISVAAGGEQPDYRQRHKSRLGRLALLGLVVMLLSAGVTALAMRLRASDAEVQLRMCCDQR